MVYCLKHFDTTLLKFSANANSSNPDYKILWVNEDSKGLLPLEMDVTPDGLDRWVRHRTIPKNRAFVRDFLAKCGLDLNRPMNIIAVTMGLSLNDCYWVTEDGSDATFARFNLYDNKFNNTLSRLVFTGYGSSTRSSLTSSPEFTTTGMLPKCWRRNNGVISLWKGGTSGASNAGFEPYSEFYAFQVADALGINAIPYGLHKWKGVLCSTCELFTSKELSYVPVGRIVRTGGMDAVETYYEKLGETFVSALYDMFLLDAVICNVDRHYGNFGFLINSATNKIVAPAPLFDHGNSLLNFAVQNAWSHEKELVKYVNSLQPSSYDGFLETAAKTLTQERRRTLRHLLEFQFKRHPRYNLPKKRLKFLESMVRDRAKQLLTI